jgi:hypothetical protein
MMTLLLWIRFGFLLALAGVVALYVWAELRSNE